MRCSEGRPDRLEAQQEELVHATVFRGRRHGKDGDRQGQRQAGQRVHLPVYGPRRHHRACGHGGRDRICGAARASADLSDDAFGNQPGAVSSPPCSRREQAKRRGRVRSRTGRSGNVDAPYRARRSPTLLAIHRAFGLSTPNTRTECHPCWAQRRAHIGTYVLVVFDTQNAGYVRLAVPFDGVVLCAAA
jgi:hypothetical protein